LSNGCPCSPASTVPSSNTISTSALKCQPLQMTPESGYKDRREAIFGKLT
jgi:hypothetical protein